MVYRTFYYEIVVKSAAILPMVDQIFRRFLRNLLFSTGLTYQTSRILLQGFSNINFHVPAVTAFAFCLRLAPQLCLEPF